MRALLLPAGFKTVLAHVGTCIAIGTELARRGHDVTVGYAGDFSAAVEASGLRIEHVRMQDRVIGRGAIGRSFRTGVELAEVARDDAVLIGRLKPDVVLVDHRWSGQLACELAGVPFITMMHSLAWMPWYREPSPWRRRARWLARPQRAPAYLLRRLTGDPVGFQRLRQTYVEARELLELVPGRSPVEGDLTACPTTPLLDPAELPPTWRYVGPVTWSADANEHVPSRRGRPLVYLTQGSTGSPDTLRRAVRELARLEIDLVATTAGLCDPAELTTLAGNVAAARLLPGDEIIDRADAVVAHGGNLTMVAAHRVGKPVVVLPHDHDQWLWADRVERLGTGVALRPPFLPGGIRRAVTRVLRRDRYRRAAAEIAVHLRGWDGRGRTADLLEGLAAG